MTLHDLFTLLNLLIGTSGHDMTQLHLLIETLGHDMTQLHYRYFP